MADDAGDHRPEECMAQVNGRDLPPPPASPVGTLIVFVLLLLAGVVAVREFLLAPPKPAAAASEGDPRPTLMLFTADWCPACRVMDRETMSRKHVKDAINARGVRFVVVDLSEPGGANEALARQYSVKSIPAMVLLDEHGVTRDKVVGAMPAEHFLRWLDKHVAQ
jgi:thiol:disulfide interchange protein